MVDYSFEEKSEKNIILDTDGHSIIQQLKFDEEYGEVKLNE